jgi:hypothetical protein
MEILTEGTIILLDITAMLLSISIIIINGLSVYFCIRAFFCKRMYCSWSFIGNGIVSLLWIATFGYVLYNCVSGTPVLAHNEFGAIIIRPIILLSSTALAIVQEEKYKKAKLYGGIICGKTSKE